MRLRERLRWLNPFHAEHAVLRTDLSPAQCIEALGDVAVSRYSPRTWFISGEDVPVIGGVSGSRFWLRRNHAFEAKWLLQQSSGVVRADSGGGSVIEMRTSMKRANAVLVIGLGALISTVSVIGATWTPYTAPWPPLAWALWPLAGIAKYLLDRLWWANDASYLRAFVSDALATHQRTPWRPYATARLSM